MCASAGVVALMSAQHAAAQTITVTMLTDTVDVDWQIATVADLPGPDGLISMSEAFIASNHTPGVQTIGFAIPANELGWIGPAYQGIAVFQAGTGFFWSATETVIVDGTTQTAFAGDTNPNGAEVLFNGAPYFGGDGSVVRGVHGSSVNMSGSSCLVEDNTGGMNITVFGGSGSTIRNNVCSTIKLDRSSSNVVIGNVTQRVRVLGGGPAAADNRIGGLAVGDRNWITGYGTYNSDGFPGGAAVQLFDTVGTLVEGNWIGTTVDGLTIGNPACVTGVSLETHNDDVVIRNNRIAGIRGIGVGPHAAGFLFGRGILASGSGAGLTIVGNTIGLDATGAPVLGSVTGIDLGDPVTHKLTMTSVVVGGSAPGDGNEVAGHVWNGILVGRDTQNVRLAGNSIHDNGVLGIDLVANAVVGYGVSPNDALDADTGGNGLQNFPVLTAVLREPNGLRVFGTFGSTPLTNFTLEFFASPTCDASGYGEGRLPLGTIAVATDALGQTTFDALLSTTPPLTWVISATATREPTGATSEFSACATTVWRNEGHALAGTSGDPLLVGQGGLAGGAPNALVLSNAAALAPAGLFVATQSNPVPFVGGLVLPWPLLYPPLLATTDATGLLVKPFTLPLGVPPGTELWLQWAVLDAAAMQGISLSNCIVGVTP
jgi:hypothetical protein